MEKKIYDNELGTILLRFSSRTTRYFIKISKGMITAVMPIDGDEQQMITFINENRQQLSDALLKCPGDILDESTQLQGATFRLHIFKTDRSDFYMTLIGRELDIACPLLTNFADSETQQILKDLISKAFRQEARRLLPGRLKALAAQHNFVCTGVKITCSRTRWGSCSSNKFINLSFWLMLLPWHLIDYVLLHELCHTVEMNHSSRFWKLMDQVTNNQTISLRAELKKYHVL